MKKHLLTVCLILFSGLVNAQDSGDIIEYETSSGLALHINASSFKQFIDSNRRFVQRLKSCSGGDIPFFNPFFGSNDYYKIVGRNNNRECVVEYGHAGLSKHRCSLNQYQAEDLSESLLSKFNRGVDIEFKTSVESVVWNSENCIVTYSNKIDGPASQEQIEYAIKQNPNLKNVLMLIENEMR